MKIGIIGGGYVGMHTALRLTQTNRDWEIEILDVDKEKIDRFNIGKSPIDDFYMQKFMSENPGYLTNISYKSPDNNWSKYDVIFISLSTNPIDSNTARLNTDLIFKLARDIKEQDDNISIVVRSTINIDDDVKIDELKINYWPEFLSQGVDTISNISQEVNVVSLFNNDKLAIDLFEELFIGKTLIKVNTKESILIKVMHNTLDAYLINITNLFANISEENGIDFNNVNSAVESLLGKRTKVKRPGIGYGGSCYPKDSYSLIEITNNEQNKNLIQAFDDFNKQQSFAFLTREDIIRNANKIVVLGSSFKGGTNDITRTPTHSLRRWLMSNDIEYKIWEPMISEKWLLENEVVSIDIEKDIDESDLVIVASDWKEFNDLLVNYSKDVIDLKSFIKNNGKMNLLQIGKK